MPSMRRWVFRGLAPMFLLLGVMLLSGCIQLACKDCDKCGAGGSVQGCVKHRVAAGGEAGCSSGYICNNPGAACDPYNENATCQTVNNGGVCSCKCQ